MNFLLKTAGVFIFMAFLSLSFSACKKHKNENEQLKIFNEWSGVVEKGELEKIVIPFLSNISEMSLYNKSLLFQQEKLDTSYVVWNIMDASGKYVKFGQIGNGPSDVLSTSLLLHEPNASSIRILDGLNIKTYKMENDSIIFQGKENCNSSYNFYNQISVVSDSLCCVKISGPHETGLFLMNVYSRFVHDSISVNQGYFNDQNVPWDFNYCLYNNKVVLARTRYDQIEVYKLNLDEKRFVVDYIINYGGDTPDNVTDTSVCYMLDVVADDNYFYLLNQHTKNKGEETYLDIYELNGKPLRRILLGDLYLQMVLLDNSLYMKKYSDDDHIYRLKI